MKDTGEDHRHTNAATAVFNLHTKQCRWPVGDPKSTEFKFCGNHRDQGYYCAEHRKAAASPQPHQTHKKSGNGHDLGKNLAANFQLGGWR